MKKEIARLNEIIGKGCMVDKAQTNDKKKDEKKDHNTSKEGIPQSRMGLATQKEPRQMEER